MPAALDRLLHRVPVCRMRQPDLILIGPYPPPLGGVSAHIVRLAHGARDRGLDVAVVNHFRTPDADPLVIAELRRNPWRYWRVLPTVGAQVLHYHHSRWDTLIAAACALRRSPAATVATVHGGELEPFLSSRKPGVVRLTRWALQRFDVLIAVSVEVQTSMETVVRRPVALIPAYLPDLGPQLSLSPAVDAFLAAGTPLVMSGYRLTVDKRGRTIYGLEIAV